MNTSSVPTPRRIAKPKWLDIRVVGGILLVVIAVVIGARVVGASSKTVPVWVATRALAAGTVISDEDVKILEVNLGEAGARYLDATVRPTGRMVSVDVQQGELLPAAALQDQERGRLVVIGVDPERMPPGVLHGSRIDLYLTLDSPGAQVAASETVVLATDLTVQSVAPPASGGLSGAGSSTFQIAVRLDPIAAQEMVRVLPSGVVTAVLITGGQQ